MALETDTVGGRVDRRARPRAALTAEFIRNAYRPHRSWAELLRGLLEGLASRTAASRGALALRGVGTLAFEAGGDAFTAQWHDAEMPARNGHAHAGSLPNGAFGASHPGAQHAAGNGRNHLPMAVHAVFPLRYGAATLGELQLAWPGGRARHAAVGGGIDGRFGRVGLTMRGRQR